MTRLRRIDGGALLVAGHVLPGTPAFEHAAVHTLGQIGEVLLATGATWQIRRLIAASGERYAPDRAALKRHLDELVAEPTRVAVIVVLGTIIDVGGAPALVTGPSAREYPDDATLPLAWIRQRIMAGRAEQVIVVVSAAGDGTCGLWLEALATRRVNHVIAVDTPELGQPLVDALFAALCGDALDPRTGTVTMASLSDYVERLAPRAALQGSRASETIAQPPPLAGLWDVRRSQLAHPARPRARAADDDLSGTVLPGRFRIDALVARGTFGTVYRARQLAVERDVAVKVLHAYIDPGSEDGRLFVHEIRSVGRIDHTNVVRIYQADIAHDGRLFFAMELLAGKDLQQLGADGPMPPERAVALVRQLVAGLAAAHDAGLVHADVKPANAIVVPRDDGERLVLVDFGLARLRAADQPAESAGGTPAYMAPEQLHEGRVDARSDLYSAALVLVWLLTGWRRPNALTLAPALTEIADADLRRVLARALAEDPAKRYASARELEAALAGSEDPSEPPAGRPQPPFRHLAPLVEEDRDRFHGRQAELALLSEHVLFRRSVIYTAPSGAGKTSLLRAGLVPRLQALGAHCIYLRCRADFATQLAAAIAPGATQIADAIASWHAHVPGTKLVLVLDQLETALADTDFVPAVLGFESWPADADVTVVLSIREDFLGRLVAATQPLEPGMPIVRLPPLSIAGARAAILGPLAEHRLAIEPALLDRLLDDLQGAAAAIGPQMGWGLTRGVYPPHLQLACSVLYEALPPGEATLTLAHYERLGGFDAIVGEHLERVLESELPDGRDAVARDLFVALVTASHERAMRSESELAAMLAATHAASEINAVLEVLRSRGLLVRVRGADEVSWELVHDSLVPRVLAWVDRKDLARRRAVELVRYHLRRSRPDEPSLLGRAELRELRAHEGAIAELEAEWQKRPVIDGWSPARLVARSRRVLRRRVIVLAAMFGAAALITASALLVWLRQAAQSREEARLRALDLGRVTLALSMFDADPQGRAPLDPRLRWTLHTPDATDPEVPGLVVDDRWLVRGTPRVEGGALVEDLEVHGGRMFLVLERGACAPSIVPLQGLPGYVRRDARVRIELTIPSCEASARDVVDVPAGPFIYAGVGEPPVAELAQYPEYGERTIDLSAFAIDRTEVTNGTYRWFAALHAATGIAMPTYADSVDLADSHGPRHPVSFVTWSEARAYCQFMGKELPTKEQWQKALRGGLTLPDGTLNPMPRRNLPWGAARTPIPANIRFDRIRLAEVATSGDVSPYGVHDLAGGVMEWTSSPSTPGVRVARGGNWADASGADLLMYLAIENPRAEGLRNYGLGFRCVVRRR